MPTAPLDGRRGQFPWAELPSVATSEPGRTSGHPATGGTVVKPQSSESGPPAPAAPSYSGDQIGLGNRVLRGRAKAGPDQVDENHFVCPECGVRADIRKAMAERDRLVADWLATPLDQWDAFEDAASDPPQPVRANTLQGITGQSFDDADEDLLTASQVMLLTEEGDGYVAASLYCPACYHRAEAELDVAEVDVADGGETVFAKGQDGTVELDSDTIRVTIDRGLGIKGVCEFSASDVTEVAWKDGGGFGGGYISFHVPVERIRGHYPLKPKDQICVGFKKKHDLEAFRRIRDIVASPLERARELGGTLDIALKDGLSVPPTTPATAGVVVLENVQLGEFQRHFDSQTAGQISGVLQHELGIHGGIVGIGRFSVGRLGVSGTSSVDLQIQATTRDDLLNDAFVAVFDRPLPSGMVETLRVVAPSENATREILAEHLRAMYEGMGSRKSIDPLQLERMIQTTMSMVSTEVGYVSDQLSAVLRRKPEPAPLFEVVGLPLGPHALLGGAIRFPGDDEWHQLFPVELMRVLRGQANEKLLPG